MAENLTSKDVLESLSLVEDEQAVREFSTSGIMPSEISNVEVKKTLTLLGLTPDDFAKSYTSADFNYNQLVATFKGYCKDFDEELVAGKPSRALEFSAKMIFELGPYIRNEKKSKGDKAIRFRFPYKKTNGSVQTLSIKTVIVSTFKEAVYKTSELDNKMVLTFKQAGMLAMSIFSKAVIYCYNHDAKILLSPLCGAVFSKDSVSDISKELEIDIIEVILMLNESTTAGGQYLPNSDIACAIVAMISATKRVTDKGVRSSMITKIVKQYSHQKKIYNARTFDILCKYALGGVPPGMDSETLIEKYNNAQAAGVSIRTMAKAITQSTYVAVKAKATESRAPTPSRITRTKTSELPTPTPTTPEPRVPTPTAPTYTAGAAPEVSKPAVKRSNK